ncbi:hypothetical protein COCNU_02G015480 [Cocos nucifera]|uniref:Uncharacterized protein n=1 Tax=Cocos nucifera TaxID=13894 RepID=A0A8K0MX73_COCNU|nr:hypothetical protein COCNU_02G015480 [Cocos nucifera]
MMELQAQSSEEGSHALTQDQIYDTVLGTRPGYVCGLGHGSKPVGSSFRTRALKSSNKELRKELVIQHGSSIAVNASSTGRVERVDEEIVVTISFIY